MIEKCYITASEIANQEVINTASVSGAVSKVGGTIPNRLIVTDQNGMSIYDTQDEIPAVGKYILLPEVKDALDNNDVFRWNYKNGIMTSYAATPIVVQDVVIGCVYMMEQDPSQGALIQKLQSNIFTITLILEIAVIIFSIIFSTLFTRRLRRVMTSISIIREGDYSHHLEMGGHDELTALSVEFNALVKKLQSSEQRRSQFVSDASHELKTPLASIKLLSDSILQNDMDIDTIKEFVSDIGNEADRLNKMSQKLLSLTRLESYVENDCEITYIAPTLQRVVRMLSLNAQSQKGSIKTDLHDDCPILIMEDDLYQIIFNMVENGIKYNKPNGSLTIAIKRSDDNAIISFSDTGVGIPEESIQHIFERFYRIDKARSRKSGGAGLGLSIVKSMVERNGGTICVESTLNEGTVFTITFPCFDPEVDV